MHGQAWKHWCCKGELETTRDEIRNKLEVLGHRITFCHVKRSIAFQSSCVSGSLATTTTSNCISGWYGHGCFALSKGKVQKRWRRWTAVISKQQLACEGVLANTRLWRSNWTCQMIAPCSLPIPIPVLKMYEQRATTSHGIFLQFFLERTEMESSICGKLENGGISSHRICKSNMCNERDLKKSKSDAGVWFADSRRRTTFSPTAQVRTL